MCVKFDGDWEILDRDIEVYKFVTKDNKSPWPIEMRNSQYRAEEKKIRMGQTFVGLIIQSIQDTLGTIIEYKPGRVINGGRWGLYCFESTTVLKDDVVELTIESPLYDPVIVRTKLIKLNVPKGTRVRRSSHIMIKGMVGNNINIKKGRVVAL